ncbi:MAG TPA: hypothetical protein VM940_00480 [Chthoniobacterales bacterium]|nr:hypothetical protein [Chthoniobacterales bacterium]
MSDEDFKHRAASFENVRDVYRINRNSTIQQETGNFRLDSIYRFGKKIAINQRVTAAVQQKLRQRKESFFDRNPEGAGPAFSFGTGRRIERLALRDPFSHLGQSARATECEQGE